MIAIRDFNVDEDLFLRDHAFGRDVSVRDPSLTGLPIMPLTMSVEMMAEAGSLLAPSQSLLSIEHVRALRWATSDTGRFTLRVEARRSTESDDCIEVTLHEHDSGSAAQPGVRSPLAEATLRFGDAPRRVRSPRLYDGAASRIHIGRDVIYHETMFHGPQFRGTVSVDAIADDGAETTVEILPRDRLFLSNPYPGFLTDPVLLDQAGQTPPLWMCEHASLFPMAFPFRIASIELYQPPPAVGTILQCVLSSATLGNSQVAGNIDVVTREGEVYARITGWEQRLFDVPMSYRDQWYAPLHCLLCQRWPDAEALGAAAGAADVQVFRVSTESFPDGFFDAFSGVWQKSLALTILSRREREVWRSLKTPPRRRLEWLLGRSAAKDAVRSYLKENF